MRDWVVAADKESEQEASSQQIEKAIKENLRKKQNKDAQRAQKINVFGFEFFAAGTNQKRSCHYSEKVTGSIGTCGPSG